VSCWSLLCFGGWPVLEVYTQCPFIHKGRKGTGRTWRFVIWLGLGDQLWLVGWLGGADCNGTALYPARAEWNPRYEQASIMNGLYDDMYYRTNTIRGNSQGDGRWEMGDRGGNTDFTNEKMCFLLLGVMVRERAYDAWLKERRGDHTLKTKHNVWCDC
jgi:hypothetical protein